MTPSLINAQAIQKIVAQCAPSKPAYRSSFKPEASQSITPNCSTLRSTQCIYHPPSTKSHPMCSWTQLDAQKDMGKDTLGSNPEEVKAHSNQSAGVMSMFLSGTSVYTIILIGRWSSNAFM
jgi:hypothetical protein